MAMLSLRKWTLGLRGVVHGDSSVFFRSMFFEKDTHWSPTEI